MSCGTYMVQRDKGLKSGCVCPSCGNFCSSCMGSPEGPKTPSELRALFEETGHANGNDVSENNSENRSNDYVDRRRLL